MDSFRIKYLKDEPYTVMVIGISYDSSIMYIDELTEILRANKVSGKVLIDSLLRTGNSYNRFIEILFDGNKFIKASAKEVKIPRSNSLRRVTWEVLSNEPEVLEFSILNKRQRDLINSGIYI